MLLIGVYDRICAVFFRQRAQQVFLPKVAISFTTVFFLIFVIFHSVQTPAFISDSKHCSCPRCSIPILHSRPVSSAVSLVLTHARTASWLLLLRRLLPHRQHLLDRPNKVCVRCFLGVFRSIVAADVKLEPAQLRMLVLVDASSAMATRVNGAPYCTFAQAMSGIRLLFDRLLPYDTFAVSAPAVFVAVRCRLFDVW